MSLRPGGRRARLQSASKLKVAAGHDGAEFGLVRGLENGLAYRSHIGRRGSPYIGMVRVTEIGMV